jgi:hypothetical protein
MAFFSKWIIPEGRGVVHNRCDTRFVELSQFPNRDVDLGGSFDPLLYVFVPP